MSTIPRDELYARLSSESDLLAAIPLQEEPPSVPEEGEPSTVVVLQCILPPKLPGAPEQVFQKVWELSLVHDLSELLLQGDTTSPDPLLRTVDGLVKRVRLGGITRDAQGADPYSAIISLLSEVDYEEHHKYAVMISPSAWADIRSAHDFRDRYHLHTEGKVGQAKLIITPYMEDREILFLPTESVKLSISDAILSTSATVPPADRAKLLLSLELDADDAQLVHNLH